MDFKIKSVSKRQGHYIIKRSVQEKDTTIINIHVPKIGAPKYKGKCYEKYKKWDYGCHS